jgi:hypothetical protein
MEQMFEVEAPVRASPAKAFTLSSCPERTEARVVFLLAAGLHSCVRKYHLHPFRQRLRRSGSISEDVDRLPTAGHVPGCCLHVIPSKPDIQVSRQAPSGYLTAAAAAMMEVTISIIPTAPSAEVWKVP